MTETWLQATQYDSIGIRRQWNDFDPMQRETGLSYEELCDGMLDELNLSIPEAPIVSNSCQLQALLSDAAGLEERLAADTILPLARH